MERTTFWGALWSVLITKYYTSDQIKKNEMGGACSLYGGEERGAYTGFWWENLRERYHMKDPGVDGKIILKWFLKTWVGAAWTGLIWIGMETDGRLLWMQKWTFGFHKMWGISWLIDNLLASQGLCSMVLVN